MRIFSLRNKFIIIVLILFMISATCFSYYYRTSDVNQNFRVKRNEEMQNYHRDFNGNINTIQIETITKDSFHIKSFDELLQLILSQKIITLILLTVIIFPGLLLHQMRRRNILVSQTENKLFLVHYLKLKDGKKNALLITASF